VSRKISRIPLTWYADPGDDPGDQQTWYGVPGDPYLHRALPPLMAADCAPVHQFVAGRLYGVLNEPCPEGLCVIPEPVVQLDLRTEFGPDLVVVRLDDVGGAKFTAPPLLVVEVRSPSTALIDLNRKKAVYEKFGVPSYWIVDPEPARPELTVFELHDSGYALEATSTQPLTVSHPFMVSITPADLTKGLLR
jgi:Uma2 family endonuclease